MEGEFISILGKPASGKTTLLNILSFLKFPDKGEVYFQGRLVGKSGAEELKHMPNERVWLFEHILTSNQIAVAVEKNLQQCFWMNQPVSSTSSLTTFFQKVFDT